MEVVAVVDVVEGSGWGGRERNEVRGKVRVMKKKRRQGSSVECSRMS